jgi:hypothetical protein
MYAKYSISTDISAIFALNIEGNLTSMHPWPPSVEADFFLDFGSILDLLSF